MRAVGMAERAMEESWMAGGEEREGEGEGKGEGGGKGEGREKGREEKEKGEGGGGRREGECVSIIIEESYYNAPDLGLYVCLFSHKSTPCRESAQDAPCLLRDWTGMFLEECRSPSCLVAKERDSFVCSLRAIMLFLKLLTLPLTVIGGLDMSHTS